LAVTYDGVTATLTWTNGGTYTTVYYYRGGSPEVGISGALQTVTFDVPAENAYNTFGVAGYVAASSKKSSYINTSGTSGINKPTNVTVTSTTTTRCDLAWTNASSLHPVFNVYRNTDPLGIPALIGTTAADAVSYTDTPVLESTTYYYRLKAQVGSVYSSFSDQVTITTGAMPNGTPVIGTATTTGQNTITVTWTDTATNATDFHVFQSIDDLDYTADVATVLPSIQVAYITGLTSKTKYYFKVKAHNLSGWSSPSASVNATTLTDLDPPTNITIVATSPTQATLSFTNNSADATSLSVERKISGGSYGIIGSGAGTDTTYLDGALAEGTTYFWRIRAYNSGLSEYGDYSVPVSMKFSYGSVGAIQINQTYVGLGNILAVATNTPTNLITQIWTSKPLDFADQNVSLENTWKTLDRIHLDYIDLYANMPLTIKVSGDGGVTWHRETDRIMGNGDGTNKCDDFYFTPLTAQYFVVQLVCSDSIKGVTWTGFDMYYIPRGGVFEVIPWGGTTVTESIDGGTFGDTVDKYVDGGVF
jgi:hypothetical protein